MSLLGLEYKKRKTTTARLQSWFKATQLHIKPTKRMIITSITVNTVNIDSLSFLCVLSVFLFSSSVKHILETANLKQSVTEGRANGFGDNLWYSTTLDKSRYLLYFFCKPCCAGNTVRWPSRRVL